MCTTLVQHIYNHPRGAWLACFKQGAARHPTAADISVTFKTSSFQARRYCTSASCPYIGELSSQLQPSWHAVKADKQPLLQGTPRLTLPSRPSCGQHVAAPSCRPGMIATMALSWAAKQPPHQLSSRSCPGVHGCSCSCYMLQSHGESLMMIKSVCCSPLPCKGMPDRAWSEVSQQEMTPILLWTMNDQACLCIWQTLQHQNYINLMLLCLRFGVQSSVYYCND